MTLLLLVAKATFVLLAGLALHLLLPRAAAGLRHLVWLVTLAALLLVPALALWSPVRIAVLPPVPASAPAASPLPASDVGRALPDEATSSTALAAAPASSASPARSTPAVERSLVALLVAHPLSVVAALWATVAAVILLSLAASALAVRRIVRRARPLTSPEWTSPLYEIADRLGIDEAPRLVQSDDAAMPFACGLRTPTIVLPASSETWAADRRHAVLLHELAHVRRHDLAGHALGRLVCAAYWFHPLAWTAARHLRAESERACDDLALACGSRAADYAEHLLDIVTSVRRDRTPGVALAMARRKEFEGRMLAILDPDARRGEPGRRQTLGVVATLTLCATLVGAAAPVSRGAAAVPQATTPSTAASIAHDVAPRPRDVRVARQRTQVDSAARRVAHVRGDSMVVVAPTPVATMPIAVEVPSASAVARVALSLSSGGRPPRSDERAALLAKVLRSDSSASLRRVAAWGLAEYADEAASSDVLAAALRADRDADVREMCAWALASGGRRSASLTDALSAALKGDASEQVRATAAWALGSAGDDRAEPALVAALGDASAAVRMRAAWAVGNVDLEKAPPALTALLADREPRVRRLAAWSLHNIADPASIPALQAAMAKETDADLQVAYVRALASMGDRSVDALKGLLESSDARVKAAAVRALAGGHATGPWPWPWPMPRPNP